MYDGRPENHLRTNSINYSGKKYCELTYYSKSSKRSKGDIIVDEKCYLSTVAYISGFCQFIYVFKLKNHSKVNGTDLVKQ